LLATKAVIRGGVTAIVTITLLVMDVLRDLGITDKKTFQQWAIHNHPDKGGKTNIFQAVSAAYRKYISNPEAAPASARAGGDADFAKAYASFFETRSERRGLGRPPNACTATTAAGGGRCSNKRTAFSAFCALHEARLDPAAAARHTADKIKRKAEKIVAAHERAKQREAKRRQTAEAVAVEVERITKMREDARGPAFSSATVEASSSSSLL
jgi:hypothetical protein